MRIGELEKRSGASRHTLRYYEDLGLISTKRSENNYREYDQQAIDDLTFIQQVQAMGFSLVEIGEVIKARREQQLDCAQGAVLVTQKLLEVEQKIADMHHLRDFLLSEKLRLEASAAEQTALALHAQSNEIV